MLVLLKHISCKSRFDKLPLVILWRGDCQGARVGGQDGERVGCCWSAPGGWWPLTQGWRGCGTRWADAAKVERLCERSRCEMWGREKPKMFPRYMPWTAERMELPAASCWENVGSVEDGLWGQFWTLEFKLPIVHAHGYVQLPALLK